MTGWTRDLGCAPNYKVPSSSPAWARTDVNQAVHGWGGVVLHDIINNAFAQKAEERRGRPDRRRLRCWRARGREEPFALIQRSASGSTARWRCQTAIATGRCHPGRRRPWGRLRLHRLGLHRHRRGARAEAYKQAIVAGTSDDIVYSNLFTGVHGNYLRASIVVMRAWTRPPARATQQDELWPGGALAP